jgi:hypothetical protein
VFESQWGYQIAYVCICFWLETYFYYRRRHDMEREDIKGTRSGPGYRARPDDDVVLRGDGREAELIVAGLKVLAGQIAVRDAITMEPKESGLFNYTRSGRSQGAGVALSGEVNELLRQIEKPHYVESATKEDEQPPTQPAQTD